MFEHGLFGTEPEDSIVGILLVLLVCCAFAICGYYLVVACAEPVVTTPAATVTVTPALTPMDDVMLTLAYVALGGAIFIAGVILLVIWFES